MSRPDWFPFYPALFMLKTASMSVEGVGCYVRLLNWAYTVSADLCSVPDDDVVLARIVGLTPKAWSRVRSEVLAHWEPLPVRQEKHPPDGERRLFNPKLREVVEEQSQRGALNAHRASHAARSRWNSDASSNASSNARRMLQASQKQLQEQDTTTKAQHPLPGTSPGTLELAAPLPPTGKASSWWTEQFPVFWAAYPRREARARALAAWKRLGGDAALLAALLDGVERWRHTDQWQRGIVPHPASWLNARRWEDELHATTTTKQPRGKAALEQFIKQGGQ